METKSMPHALFFKENLVEQLAVELLPLRHLRAALRGGFYVCLAGVRTIEYGPLRAARDPAYIIWLQGVAALLIPLASKPGWFMVFPGLERTLDCCARTTPPEIAF